MEDFNSSDKDTFKNLKIGDPKPGVGALRGHQWEPWVIARWCYEEGWTNVFDLMTSVQVCLAESQGYDHAIHVNLNGSRDRGLWQLNDIHESITDEIAYDPVKATHEARKLYVARGDWSDWSAFNSDVYLHDSYLGRAARGVGNFMARMVMNRHVKDWAGKPYEHQYGHTVLNYEHRLVGMKTHVEKAMKMLGSGPKTAAQVREIQKELTAAIGATVPVVPRNG